MSRPPGGEWSGQSPPLTDGGVSGPRARTHRVLVVDDEELFARAVAEWLDDHWETEVATDGDAAVKAYGPHIDAVLLDRKMPGLSGREVVERLRTQDGETRIAMMTAVEPDWDIVDMDFDMYIEKPVTRTEAVETVQELLERSEYAQELQALFALSAKMAKLRERYPGRDLEADPRFQRLESEFDRVRGRAQSRLEGFDPDEVTKLMQVVEDADS